MQFAGKLRYFCVDAFPYVSGDLPGLLHGCCTDGKACTRTRSGMIVIRPAPWRPLLRASSLVYAPKLNLAFTEFQEVHCPQATPSYGEDSHVAYVSRLASLLECPGSMQRARRGTRLPSSRNSERLSLTSSRKGVRVNPQKNARVTGVLFLITFIASIPALILYGPVLNNPNYIVGAGADTRIYWGRSSR